MKTKQLNKQWKNYLEILDVAFQPILNMNSGKTIAVEALLRNHQDVGFRSIFDLFDAVHREGILYAFDMALREKAFKKFTQIPFYEDLKLFFNLDNRLLEMDDFATGNTSRLLKKFNIKKDNICFEISERHEISSDCNIEMLLKHYQDENYNIAIDDFGVGYSGYKLLYDSTPNTIKIDRYFLQNIEQNRKKKMLVRNITHLAIQLGIEVIAEGVESVNEFYTCKEIGCHLVQGYLVQHPTKDTSEIQSHYEHIEEVILKDKRAKKSNKIEEHIEKIEPLFHKTKMPQVLEYFKNHKNSPIVPVVNNNQEPVGILHESKIKDFLYSPFGISLLLNDCEYKSKLRDITDSCAHADINSSMNTIIELFSNNPESYGIVITKDSKYYGFLSVRSIISIINEENVVQAMDQNPLTKLPGNRSIERYLYDVSQNSDSAIICYFDLDNFKAYNDKYGFRRGDRIIQFFADLMQTSLKRDFFKAHIGGDDFFCALELKALEEDSSHLDDIVRLVEKFESDVKQFYSDEDRKDGYIISKDREGKKKKFPLLCVSASIILITEKTEDRSVENMNAILSLQKKVAKSEPKHIALSSVL